MATFTIGSSEFQVMAAHGAPNLVVQKSSPVMPYFSRWNGLIETLGELPDGGFIYLYGPTGLFIYLGFRAWVAFDANKKVIDARANPGHELNMPPQPTETKKG